MRFPWLALAFACASPLLGAGPSPVASPGKYFDSTGRADAWTGGARMIEITTPEGRFKVWTKRVGNNPRIKVLLLHGGPGGTHEYFEACDSFFPKEGMEYYYYDQLGSYYSDQPDDESLWTMERYVDEVEQVRQALGLNQDNFYLLGQSWGGMLAIEYALKYQANLKGLVISNAMASTQAYDAYANRVLMPAMDRTALQEILRLEAAKDFANPRYDELLTQHYYKEHFLRLPPDQWPEPVIRTFRTLNKKLYTLMQGPSEMGASPDCRLAGWDRSKELKNITVPTLVVGATHDTMDPQHLKWMAAQLPRGRFHLCPNGSHLSIYDDQEAWFGGVISFIRQVDANP